MFCLDVFCVNETSTDRHETFLNRFIVELTALSGELAGSFNITRNLAKWKVKFYPKNMICEDNVCAEITLLECKQDIVNLAVEFDFETQHSAYVLSKFIVLTIQRYETSKLLLLMSRSTIITPANKLLAADKNAFIVRVRGSYVINSQHNVVTSPSQFVAFKHKTIDITYTWTVCNLKLPLNGDYVTASALFPSVFNDSLPAFQMHTFPGIRIDNYVSNYIVLNRAPNNVKLPLNVSYSFNLINSSDKHNVVAQYEKVQSFDIGKKVGKDKSFKYSDSVRSMNDQCATIQCRAVHDISTNYTQ
jgi:hypothetical protein